MFVSKISEDVGRNNELKNNGTLFEQLLDTQALCNEAWVNSVADREWHDKAADMLLLEPLFNEHFEEEVAAFF